LKFTGGVETHQGIRFETCPNKALTKLAGTGATKVNAEISISYKLSSPKLIIDTADCNRIQISDFQAGFCIEGSVDDAELSVEIDSMKYGRQEN
jgi:hypothetical protein